MYTRIMRRKDFDDIIHAEVKGDAEEKEYRVKFEKALQRLNETGFDPKIDYILLYDKYFPGRSLTRAIAMESIPFKSKLYHARNKYTRKVFDLLFPVELLLSVKEKQKWTLRFWHLKRKKKAILKQTILDKIDDESAVDGEYDLRTKRRKESKTRGLREKIPTRFYTEALKEIESDSSLTKSFIEYLVILHLASEKLQKEHISQIDRESMGVFEFYYSRIINIFRSKQTVNEIIVETALDQIYDNFSNYADLFAAIVHMGQHKATDTTLRHFFKNEQGKIDTAKCGFMGAFSEHLPIFLPED